MADKSLGKSLAWTTRGGIVETRHTAHVAVVHHERTILSLGNPQLLNPMRSTGKPYFLRPLLLSGKSNITDEQVALFASSHNGERYHTDLLRLVLDELDVSVDKLNLGPQPPIVPGLDFDPPLSGADLVGSLQNNCSGKHVAAMLLARHLGQDPVSYCDSNGAAISSIRETMHDLARSVDSDIVEVIDGCGFPTFALSLLGIARLYARLADDQADEAAVRVWKSFLRFPEAVGGSLRANTEIMRLGILAKEGFEGLFVLVFDTREGGLSVLVKVDSGSDPVAEAFVVALVEQITGADVRDRVYPGFELFDQLGGLTGQIHIDPMILHEIVQVVRGVLGNGS